MILLIDNYDSFTYNIFHYFVDLGQEVIVKRNDEISLPEIEKINPSCIVIGPGPCTPDEAGISVELVKKFAGHIPLFGVCLGLQAINIAFGGKIKQARVLMHGKNCNVYHNDKGVFQSLPNPISCTRYHSLVIDREFLPSCLEINAWTLDDNEIMALIHKKYQIEGVQFHPEAFLTEYGSQIFANFLKRYLNDDYNR